MSESAVATFGAGCFWGVEAAFRNVDGVLETAVGYEGGRTHDPSYEDVCRGDTGHAEVVEVRFDPARVSYRQLLDVFFSTHDPTQRDRQGPDVGTQYRSAVFVHDDEQRAQAQAAIDEIERSGRLPRPIVTQIVPAATFWRAEEYHQRYLEKRGQASCRIG